MAVDLTCDLQSYHASRDYACARCHHLIPKGDLYGRVNINVKGSRFHDTHIFCHKCYQRVLDFMAHPLDSG